MKQRNVTYIRVLLVVLSIVILLAFVNRTPQRIHHDTWLPSSFNPVGAGNMALFDTLQDLHWPVVRWREPLSRLTRYGNDNVLIITRSRLGANIAFSEQETDLLGEWVAKGNTLLLLGALDDWEDTRLLLREFGFVAPDRNGSVTDLLQPFEPTDQTDLMLPPAAGSAQSGTMIISAATALPPGPPSGMKVLRAEANNLYLVELPHGAGRVICGASERLLSNAYVGKGDNLAIILQMLERDGKLPSHVFFEESHHGFSSVFAVVRLFHHPGVRFAGLLALLGALTFLGTSLIRFGPVVPLHRESGRSTLEFVDSIADLYRRADLRDDTIRYLFAETHQRALQRLNLPPTASHDVIAARLLQAHPQLPKWKKLAQRFDSRDYIQGLPPSGWLRVAKDLIQIKSSLA